MLESSSARASTSCCRSRRSTSRGSRRTATASRCRCSSPRRTRSAARTTRRRPTRCCSGSACTGPTSGACNGAAEVAAAARELGYPDRPVCFKPVFSSGSRGFRILDPTVDRAHQLLHERPGSVAMRLEEAVELLPDEGGPDLLVMELATGGERTIDGIADGKRVVLGHPKTREAMRAGLAMYFVTLEDEELMALADALVAELAIEWFFNIQLVGEHVIEINPRISTIVYQDDLNLPYLGVKRALGEISDEELAALRSRVRPGRASLRYFDQVDFDGAVGRLARARGWLSGRCASPTARSTPPACRGRTRRRCGGAASTRGSSSSSATSSTPRRTESLDAPSNRLLLGRQATAVGGARAAAAAHGRLPLLLRADARAAVAPVPDPARARARSRSSTTSARTSAARRPSSSRTAGRRTRRSSAATTRSAGCRRRR